ncbi:AI-2E family transporter [Paenibacillus sp. B2(2019)]|uniref:AI-2E family transporter n=1 Tax=Paenibacillus sp. B2(2019) TaxID=2607754 RepID=UPI0011F2156B|nr:AI-2E family transporter [Paenibacillus sp. B2(2019)]KAA1185202.1 AI-2E family transporter [Paenibacillus sp. B2(2019)]
MAKLNTFIRVCIAILLVLGIVFLGSQVNFIFSPILSLFNVIIVPLMLAGFFYYLLRPLINTLERYKLNRSVAIIIVYVVIALLLFGFSIGVWPSLRTQLINFVDNMPNLIAAVNQQLLRLEDSGFLASIIPADMDLASQLTEYLNKGFNLISNYVTGLFSFVSNFAIILFTFPIMLFYMLKEGGKFGRKIVSFFPKKYRGEGTTMMSEIDSALSGFIVGRVLVNLALGVLMYIGFLIIGLQYALLLTVIAVVMNFVPFIGAILSSIPIFIIGFIQSPSIAVWSIIIVLVAQQIQDNLIAPYIFGKKLDIHPLTTIILVLVGGDIGGIIAILLIIPLYMIVKILLTKVYNLFVKNHRAESGVEVEVEESL